MLIIKITGKAHNVFAILEQMARLAGNKLTIGEIARLNSPSLWEGGTGRV